MLLLLAVFCEKTECILENVVCGSQLGNLTLELTDADGLLLRTQRLRRRRIAAYIIRFGALPEYLNLLS